MNILRLLVLTGASALLWPSAAAARSPNFLVILTDNLGKDWFGCYGADGGHTPNIDRLAAGGVHFQHCYATPLCSNTRVQFLTGRYGFSTGWHTHHDAAIYGGGGLDWKRERTWARVLRVAGVAGETGTLGYLPPCPGSLFEVMCRLADWLIGNQFQCS